MADYCVTRFSDSEALIEKCHENCGNDNNETCVKGLGDDGNPKDTAPADRVTLTATKLAETAVAKPKSLEGLCAERIGVWNLMWNEEKIEQCVKVCKGKKNVAMCIKDKGFKEVPKPDVKDVDKYTKRGAFETVCRQAETAAWEVNEAMRLEGFGKVTSQEQKEQKRKIINECQKQWEEVHPMPDPLKFNNPDEYFEKTQKDGYVPRFAYAEWYASHREVEFGPGWALRIAFLSGFDLYDDTGTNRSSGGSNVPSGNTTTVPPGPFESGLSSASGSGFETQESALSPVGGNNAKSTIKVWVPLQVEIGGDYKTKDGVVIRIEGVLQYAEGILPDEISGTKGVRNGYRLTAALGAGLGYSTGRFKLVLVVDAGGNMYYGTWYQGANGKQKYESSPLPSWLGGDEKDEDNIAITLIPKLSTDIIILDGDEHKLAATLALQTMVSLEQYKVPGDGQERGGTDALQFLAGLVYTFGGSSDAYTKEITCFDRFGSTTGEFYKNCMRACGLSTSNTCVKDLDHEGFKQD